MNVKPKFVYYDIRRKQSVCLIMYTHENDVDTQVLEVSMLDNGEPIELSADYTYSAAIVNRDTQALIDDSVSCTLNESGNVLIPIDNFHTLGAQDLLIELTITDSAGNQVLVTPFPLWIHVNASILDDAQVTPESQGTVPELLEEAKEALENAGDYENLENKPQINGHELVGNKSSDDLGLQNKLTAGENITINANGEISSKSGSLTYTRNSYTYTYPIIGTYWRIYEDDFKIYISNYGDAYYTIFPGKHIMRRIDVVDVSSKESLDNVPMNTIAYLSTRLMSLPSNSDGGTLITYGGAGTKWAQFIVTTTGDLFYSAYTKGDLSSRNWNKLNGQRPKSAYVNQNGTITFTMSDGSTVTTTGESVIGESAYQVAVDNGFIGTEQEWLASLKGEQGDDYVLTAQDKTDIANIVLSELPTTQGVQYGNTSN